MAVNRELIPSLEESDSRLMMTTENKVSAPVGTTPAPAPNPALPPAPPIAPAPTAPPMEATTRQAIPGAPLAPTFPAPAGPPGPTGIVAPTGGSMRDLIPTPAPAGPATPPIGPGVAPVVGAPVLSTVAENETVAGQLRTLLDEGSPLLTQARNRALIQMQGRGLLNSTMAGQAGEEAFIGAAAPIAAADAATYGQRAVINQETQNRFGLAEQGFQHQRTLNAESSMQRMAEQAMAGDVNSRLQLEQAGYNFQLSAQQNLARMNELAAQGNIQASLAVQAFNHQAILADLAQGHSLELEDQRFQTQQQLLFADYGLRQHLSTVEQSQQIERMNLAHRQTLEQITATAAANGAESVSRLGSQYLAAVSERMSQTSNEIANIYSTQGLSSAQQQTAVANAYARLQADTRALQTYYQQSPMWDTSWGSNVAPPSVAPGATPFPGGPGVPSPSIPPMGPGTSGVQQPLPYGPQPYTGLGSLVRNTVNAVAAARNPPAPVPIYEP